MVALPDGLAVSRRVHDALIADLRAALPLEGCGFLVAALPCHSGLDPESAGPMLREHPNAKDQRGAAAAGAAGAAAGAAGAAAGTSRVKSRTVILPMAMRCPERSSTDVVIGVPSTRVPNWLTFSR